MSARISPTYVSDDAHLVAVEVLDAWEGLRVAKGNEPDWTPSWRGTGERAWRHWSDREYEPAADRWRRAVDALRPLVPFTLGHPGTIRGVAADLIAAYQSCESCRRRPWSTVVVIDGEPFRVCGGCVLPKAGAVA
ncbi:MAG: hypothetical protein J2P24_08285 [Streptosporangiales bacterium]|nr:hypothetical protein [Streptosporangiales bacterium]